MITLYAIAAYLSLGAMVAGVIDEAKHKRFSWAELFFIAVLWPLVAVGFMTYSVGKTGVGIARKMLLP